MCGVLRDGTVGGVGGASGCGCAIRSCVRGGIHGAIVNCAVRVGIRITVRLRRGSIVVNVKLPLPSVRVNDLNGDRWLLFPKHGRARNNNYHHNDGKLFPHGRAAYDLILTVSMAPST